MQLALIRFDAIFLQQIPQLPTIVPRDEVHDCLRLKERKRATIRDINPVCERIGGAALFQVQSG